VSGRGVNAKWIPGEWTGRSGDCATDAAKIGLICDRVVQLVSAECTITAHCNRHQRFISTTLTSHLNVARYDHGASD